MSEEQWTEESLNKKKVPELKALLAEETTEVAKTAPKKLNKSDLIALLLKSQQERSGAKPQEQKEEEQPKAEEEKKDDEMKDGDQETEEKKQPEEEEKKAVEEDKKSEEGQPPMKKQKTGEDSEIVKDKKEEDSAKSEGKYVLFVEGFVRPFTVKNLQTMLETKFGKVTDLWLNDIKTFGYVTFETSEAYELAKKELDGMHWPESNKCTLSVRDSNPDEAQRAKRGGSTQLRPVVKQDVANLPQSRQNASTKDRKEEEPAAAAAAEPAPREPPIDIPLAEEYEKNFNKTETQPTLYWLTRTGKL